MATFDVRNSNTEEITEIVFADNDEKEYIPFIVQKNGFYGMDICAESLYVGIESKEHAENLIKALRKAIELGWVE